MVSPHEREPVPIEHEADVDKKHAVAGASIKKFFFQQFAQRPDHPLAAVFVSALREWRRAFEGNTSLREAQLPGIMDRIEKAMTVTITRETDGLERNLGFLATVGATAPFVGLFGTVWGIMNSFSAIAARHDTTLAVVAPGIAEALLATAFGLAAAIPAVIIYNHFARVTKSYLELVSRSSGAAGRLLSRDLDRSHGAAHSRAAE